jgi:hypothetical protein
MGRTYENENAQRALSPKHGILRKGKESRIYLVRKELQQ